MPGVAADPVAIGFVASLARPDGNLTGLAGNVGPQIYGKTFQLLKEAVPKVSRVVVLGQVRTLLDNLIGDALGTGRTAGAVRAA